MQMLTDDWCHIHRDRLLLIMQQLWLVHLSM